MTLQHPQTSETHQGLVLRNGWKVLRHSIQIFIILNRLNRIWEKFISKAIKKP